MYNYMPTNFLIEKQAFRFRICFAVFGFDTVFVRFGTGKMIVFYDAMKSWSTRSATQHPEVSGML